MKDYPFIREIRSPISDEQLRPLDPRCSVVQFDSPLTEMDFVKLSRFMEPYSSVPLRIYGHHGIGTDLQFLRHFPFLKGFQADLFDLVSLDGLAHLPPSLEFLALGATRRRLSLRTIARFHDIRKLSLEGYTKDVEVIGQLSELSFLTLRSITLPNLSILTSLRNLKGFALKLGGTKDLSLLSKVGRLNYLELWMIRGLTDVSAISELVSLRYLFLEDLKSIQTMPSLQRLTSLSRCDIDNLKGLRDLTPIAAAPNLKEIVVVNMGHLSPGSFESFRNHITLRAATIGIGSQKKNDVVAALLRKPKVTGIKPIEKYMEAHVTVDRVAH
jgi:internalin A